MNTTIIIGEDRSGQPCTIDMEELLATRLLVQGNSGSGKSHLLRRLLEESADMVQQVVIDPEGDFTSLADIFPHIVIDGAAHSAPEIEALARRVREHRASVVLALEGLDVEQQIRCAAQFIGAMFDAPREHWYPALVVVDEAQMFAPAVSGEISEDTRRLSMNAMTNLMCRGRKRGLAGIVATQRLAKLAKNVAAEASNFLMGRTFLDIDMIRAADLLGMERRQAEHIRDLDRGSFLGLGPAIARRPLSIHIGPTRTGTGRNASGLMPLPQAKPAEMEALLHAELEQEAAPPPVERPVPQHPAQSLSRNLDILDAPPEPVEATPAESGGSACDDMPSQHDIIRTALRALAADPDSTYQSASGLFQSFLTRCRAAGAHAAHIDMEQFRRDFAFALARIDRLDAAQQRTAEHMAADVDSDILAPYLVILRSAFEGRHAPDDDELAAAYGTSSPGRIRRLLDHIETLGLIVIREEYGGGRTLLVPGIETAAAAQTA
ncbi:helicase HerA domain-containing protein [Pontixanthobacter sp.]|uniref:helicase HerA domain-containing protein n=1 Tax=Pontixanthobacter sp. TaxID=2792078 RepID=UPI003C7C1502